MPTTACALKLDAIDARLKDLKLFVHEAGDLHVSKAVADTGIWEAYETQLISQLLFEGACFVDVGANIGYYSVIASQLVGDSGQVFAFEPEAKNYSLLTKNCQSFALPNTLPVNAGLANRDEASEIFLSTDNFGDHQIYDGGKQRSHQSIQLVKGDSFLNELSAPIHRIDVLKIDTQGAEVKVIQGLKETLLRSAPALNIIIEFWPFGLKKAGDHGHQLLDLLLSLSLPMAIIDHINHGLIPCTEKDLRDWVDDLDAEPENEGFMNILLGHKLL